MSARLRHRHIDTASDLLKDGSPAEVHQAIHAEFDALDDLLRGISAVGELTERTNDLVVSFGESHGKCVGAVVDRARLVATYKAGAPPSASPSAEASPVGAASPSAQASP